MRGKNVTVKCIICAMPFYATLGAYLYTKVELKMLTTTMKANKTFPQRECVYAYTFLPLFAIDSKLSSMKNVTLEKFKRLQICVALKQIICHISIWK